MNEIMIERKTSLKFGIIKLGLEKTCVAGLSFFRPPRRKPKSSRTVARLLKH